MRNSRTKSLFKLLGRIFDWKLRQLNIIERHYIKDIIKFNSVIYYIKFENEAKSINNS